MPIPKFANTVANQIGRTLRQAGQTAGNGGAQRVLPVNGPVDKEKVDEVMSGGGRRSNANANRKRLSQRQEQGDQRTLGDYVSSMISSSQQGGKSKTSQADAAADDLDSFTTDRQEQERQEQEEAENIITDADDMFLADFNAYSRDNLGGMGLYDFLVVDPNSQEDRDMWQAFWDDPTMGRYYGEQKQQYGDFDAYWDAMTANTIDDVMASNELQRQYFNNTGGDSMLQIFQGAANEGFIPEISGDQWRQEDMENMYASDADLAALTMMYQYGMNGALDDESGLDLETDPLAVAKLNDYLQLGNMQFGAGDGYDTKVGDLPEYESVDYVDPAAYDRSVEKGLASVPGYGLPDIGIRAIMNDRYGVGYQLRPGVDDLYSSYYDAYEEDGEK